MKTVYETFFLLTKCLSVQNKINIIYSVVY